MAYIYIVPIETSTEGWLEPLEHSVQSVFGVQAKCSRLPVDLGAVYDETRAQYNSSEILIQLIADPPADAVKILGVTDVDLFIPILTFVFGEAQLDGIGAVVSLHRLNNGFYGMPEDNRLLVERMLKESVHELGHTFGLLHCTHPGCVLNASTYVEDIDQKSVDMCPQCRAHVQARPDLPGGTPTQGFGSTVLK